MTEIHSSLWLKHTLTTPTLIQPHETLACPARTCLVTLVNWRKSLRRTRKKNRPLQINTSSSEFSRSLWHSMCLLLSVCTVC
jgi:hypothetical protein